MKSLTSPNQKLGHPTTIRKALWITSFVLLALVVAALVTVGSAQSQAPSDLIVYDDALASGWESWSWDTTIDFANSSPVYSGTNSISVTHTAAWGGLYLHANALSLSTYDTLRFWLHGGSAGGQDISVSINQNGSSYQVIATVGTWQEVEIPLSELGSPTAVSDLIWQSNVNDAQPTFYLDDVTFVNTGSPLPTPSAGPALSVDVAAARHSISPYIYGMNFTGEDLADELGLPVRRWGGNSTTRYNWQIDVHNTGLDWYFENVPDTPGRIDAIVEQNLRTGTESILTMPLIGWTPKRRLESHPYDCGFKVSVYGTQDNVDPWDTDCGSGEQGGVEITGNDPSDTSIPITTTFVTSWINHLTDEYGTAAEGGVMFYNLDNEPMLWNSTHRDVHPEPADYDEMRDRTYDYGAVVKATDPTAQTLGPVVWGWCAYLYSAADGCSPGPDRASHGNMDFTPWYLQQMAAYEQANGVRILDYLDLHYYPQANGVALSSAGNAQAQALRLRSTRSLWDPTYQDESWISDTTNDPIQFIPRMKQWIADNYPGTKTAITEYNWGALDHINGALAQADVLGIFGREGLDLATLWGPPDTDEPAAYAFRLYLNYDGLGSTFGETSIQASSTDQEQLAIYAAQRDSDAALTLIAINKTGESLTSTLSLANFAFAPTAQVFRYSPANLSAIVQEADQPVSTGEFTTTYPANSITLFVVPSQASSQPDLTPSYKAVSSPVTNYGEQVTYTVVIRNSTGPLTTTVLFTDTVPAGLSYTPGTLAATSGTVNEADAPTLHWSGVLTPTPAVTITYAVTVPHIISGTATLALPQIITNTATIAVPGYDPVIRTAAIWVNPHKVYLPMVMR
ncbi:MAG: DUF11 domain-containing protein [Chloroflexi bacterium]|nr:DUF11 domain-containing protein [Chloroflexota bacterium]